MRGWAIDPDTNAPIQVYVYVDGTAGYATTADVSRPDVDNAFHRGVNHGFDFIVPVCAGRHTVCVWDQIWRREQPPAGLQVCPGLR
ncbi:hypothetical protein FDG2_6418 [Candidatus Protofrankia californiensis]|uniref:Uncharacterized protein n=1 Tax=Candidatus Protofrankia californiensis TaxID=1839754 RepID=A0A1C3PH47_9ACTN|nr:hypothetical protein FDG2_6418 [Candidatus Protofrankia californiensis]